MLATQHMLPFGFATYPARQSNNDNFGGSVNVNTVNSQSSSHSFSGPLSIFAGTPDLSTLPATIANATWDEGVVTPSRSLTPTAIPSDHAPTYELAALSGLGTYTIFAPSNVPTTTEIIAALRTASRCLERQCGEACNDQSTLLPTLDNETIANATLDAGVVTPLQQPDTHNRPI